MLKKMFAVGAVIACTGTILTACNKTEEIPDTTEAVTTTTTTAPTTTSYKDDTKKKFILYLSGIDVWGSVDIESRSDVNLLLSVNREMGKIQVVNTPRDTYVYLPQSGNMRDKLTHAGLYGIDCSKAALEKLYGVEIDYYLRLNFSGFEKFIDALGGIDVYSEKDFTVDPIKHYVIGENHLTGLESLAFARERKAFIEGDNQRGRDQMLIVDALVRKLTEKGTLKNFSNFLKDIKGMYNTDMPKELINSFVSYQKEEGTKWKVETYAIEANGSSEYTYSVPNQKAYVAFPVDSTVKEGAKLLNDNIGRK